MIGTEQPDDSELPLEEATALIWHVRYTDKQKSAKVPPRDRSLLWYLPVLPPLRGLSQNIHTLHIDLTYTGCRVPDGSVVKYLPASAGDTGDAGLIPESGRSPGEGDRNPLQYSSLGNSMNRGACGATVHGVEKNQTRLRTAHIGFR